MVRDPKSPLRITQVSSRLGLGQPETVTRPGLDPGQREVFDAAATFDHVSALSDGLRQAVDAGTASVWNADDGTSTVAVAVAALQGERLAVELAVHPDARRHGVGRQLVATVLAELSDDEPWFWAHGDHPGAAQLAEEFGLARSRELLQLRVPAPAEGSGEGFGSAQLPDNVVLRTFVPGQDDTEWVRVNNAAFSWHPEQGHQTEADISAASREPDFDVRGFFLAVEQADPARILGFHQTKIHGQADGGLGEVYVLGVDPHVHSRGLGKALTVAGLNYLVSRGVATIQLYVEGDNAAAVGLYGSLGFQRYAIDVSYHRMSDTPGHQT
ncbi:mycothiol synthase [Saxibacter everestensis]|uniref:Mycothiol acetyltransferase n=1 Tax=Saxibacter everestensis TaxID=2909229 RepID=A0ABY8QW57_9MICO|nr:mycothiol synthase [Brevibacteriaceae bacterium ZFBP1038]